MKKQWWKESVVYQIYPRSFQDSNGDGIGDLRGIIQRLDHLSALGVDVVWLSPVYRSPNDDMGYDISDYQNIMDEFGTLDDWQEMLSGLHQRGIRLVMDLVVNHTSDEHPWFQESRKSKDNPYRDFYIWREGRDGGPPTNWLSTFGGPAWEYDEATGEYYLHIFSRKQPDLNWENERVRREIYAMMRWWLERGIDGFRMDVINVISKPTRFVDAPPEKLLKSAEHACVHGPRLLEFLGEMRREALAGFDTLTVGETPGVTPEIAVEITNPANGPLDMVFQFEHMGLDADPASTSGMSWRPWSLQEMKAVMTHWQAGLDGRGWNSQYFSNHDQPRQVSRFGDDGRYRLQSAKLLATLLHFLQGTPYVYQGEEIGMTNVAFPSIDNYRDIWTLNAFREFREQGMDEGTIMELIHRKSRDNARTPMQWDGGEHAGFTNGTPWIGVNPNHDRINVEEAVRDPDSIFHYYRRLIELRKQHPVIVHGRYDLVLENHPTVYGFTRTLEDRRLLVLLNVSTESPEVTLPKDLSVAGAEVLIGNYPMAAEEKEGSLRLQPYEAVVYRLNS